MHGMKRRNDDRFRTFLLAIAKEFSGDRAQDGNLKPLFIQMRNCARKLGERTVPACTNEDEVGTEKINFPKVITTKNLNRWLNGESALRRASFSALVYLYLYELKKVQGKDKPTVEPLRALAGLCGVTWRITKDLIKKTSGSFQSNLAHALHVNIAFPVRQPADANKRFLDIFRGVYRVYRHAIADEPDRFVQELLYLTEPEKGLLGFSGMYFGAATTPNRPPRRWDCTGFFDAKFLYVSMWSPDADLYVYEHMRIARGEETGSDYLAGFRVGQSDFIGRSAVAIVALERLEPDAYAGGTAQASELAKVSQFADKDVGEVPKNHEVHTALKKLFLAKGKNQLVDASSTAVQFDIAEVARRFAKLRQTK